jgi:hypothetical protein
MHTPSEVFDGTTEMSTEKMDDILLKSSVAPHKIFGLLGAPPDHDPLTYEHPHLPT